MSGQLLSSKVVIVEEEPRVRGIASAPTSVAGAVGITERGPIGQAVLCSSFDEFQTRFGGFTPDSDLALAAMGFFENGGSQLWVVRTAHFGDPAQPSTVTAQRALGFIVAGGGPTPAVLTGAAAGPFALQDGDRVVLSANGGADVEAVFRGAPAAVAAVGAGPYALADGMTLMLRLDGGTEQHVIFAAADFANVAQATAAEVSAALNASIAGGKASSRGSIVGLASDTLGTSSRVQVTGGTANTPLGFPAAVSQGTGNVSDLRAVTALEMKAVVEAAVPGVLIETGLGGAIGLHTVATGVAATLQARAPTAAAFGLDTLAHAGVASGVANAIRVEGKEPGGYANRLEVEVRAATNGSATAFDLLVVEDGTYRETFPNLTLTAADARHIERVINDGQNGSLYLRVTQVLATVPQPQTVALAGGNDGLSGLDDTDFIGSELGKTGLHALDQVQELSLLLVPGRATPATHLAMVQYAEVARDGRVFAILDPPAGQSATAIVTYVGSTAALEGLSEFAALYWPRVSVLNPAKSVFGSAGQVVVPPSGIIAGVFSRADTARPGGVYDAPAGIEAGRMFGVLGFETDEVLEEKKRDLVYPHRVNPLTTGPGLPRFIDGSRTLKGDGNFPYVGERRGVIFIERSLKQGLEFARHKANTESLRAQVQRTITAFLLAQMNNGAFRSRDPAKAFFVDVSDALNTPSVVFAGKLIARVGLATNKPAEFIILRISQDTRALEAELAGANP
ncbi:MAG: phage tail protein [Archangium sp.]|nr:phage tail protein [Archangium sp.]